MTTINVGENFFFISNSAVNACNMCLPINNPVNEFGSIHYYEIQIYNISIKPNEKNMVSEFGTERVYIMRGKVNNHINVYMENYIYPINRKRILVE